MTTQDIARAITQIGSEIWTVLLSPSTLPLLEAELPGRSVPYAEFDLHNRVLTSTIGATSRFDSLRIRLGLLRRERALRNAVRHAAGIQCNGRVAYDAYGHLNPHSLLFFDSRVAESTIPEQPAPMHSTLQLAFSGRLIPQKGVLDAIEAFSLARHQGLNASLHVFGSGKLGDQIPHDDPGIVIHGSVPYRPDWVSFMSTEIDALLIPHRQGDPSCTYIEGMGCGLPFISYTNDTASDLAAKSSAGWTAPLGDTEALARLLLDLQRAPERVMKAKYAALAFARQHSFERESAMRAAHLRAC
nr:glycosyltransferase [Actinomyces sp.]